MMFLDCPAYLDRDGALRCGLPAEVEDRVTMPSTGGPVEILRISCPAGHWFNGPLESLTRHVVPGHEPALGEPELSQPGPGGADQAVTAGRGRTR
jgi:hypothetical protein